MTHQAKKWGFAVCLLALGGAAHAQDGSVTLYGIADGGLTFSNNQGGSSAVQATSGGLGSSRWGLRGTEDLGGGISSFFELEDGFNLQTGQATFNGRAFGRQAFVGLGSAWGKLSLGRQDDLMGEYLGRYSGSARFSGPMGTHAGDVDNLFTSYKLSNVVKYTSRVYGGLSFGGLYEVGGVPGAPGSNQAWGMGARYASGPVSVGAVFRHLDNPAVILFDGANSAQGGTAFANPVTNPIFRGYSSAATLDTYGVGGSVAFGASILSANLTNTQFNHVAQTPTTPRGAFSPSISNVEVTYARHLSKALLAGISYAYTHAERAKYSQVTFGGDYFLSKRTRLYAIGAWQHASGIDSTGKTAVADITTLSASSTPNQLAARVGVSVRF